MLKYIFFATFLCFAIKPTPAYAQDKALTESNVKNFITKTTKLAAGHSDGLSSEKIIKYLEKHLHKNARFKTTMRYAIPGFDAQENEMSFDKSEFIDNVRNSAGTVEDYENDIDIITIKISKDKRSATVETRSNEAATLPVNDEDTGLTQIPMAVSYTHLTLPTKA